IAAFIIFTSVSSFAQNDGAGNTGMSFLKLGVGAESIAMGEAYSTLSDDATAVIYNPARLSFGDSRNVTLMHNSSIQVMNNDFIAVEFSFGKVALGPGGLRSDIDDIEIRQTPGVSIGTFSSDNLSIGLSVAYKMSTDISVGVTAKWLYEKIYIDDATGLGFDLAANYQKNNLSISAVIANLGSMDALRNVE